MTDLNQHVIDVIPSSTALARNRVLRNTYALLALSLIPTAIGAWIGVASGFHMSGILSFLLFFGGAIGFQLLVFRYRNSSLGVLLLLAFTGLMGFFLSNVINWALGFRNGGELVMMAAGGTAAIMFGMSLIAGSIKRDISGWGNFLLIGLLVMIGIAIIGMIFSIPALMLVWLFGILAISSGLIIYDTKRIIDGGETNYVIATMQLYLNLFNIFVTLLQLLGIFGGRSE